MLWRKAVWHGDWSGAERLLPQREPALDRAAIATYRALASGDAKEKEAATAQVMGLGKDCCVLTQAELLTLLGRHAEAIALLQTIESARASRPPPPNLGMVFLAEPAVRSLWHDPAIKPFLVRHGWIDYWRASGTRPDVCGEARAPAFCRLLSS
jgi:hypothetical protein